ncbi:MAG: glycosyltransferase family 2 protein [Lachnospiraceae bacterium]|nr:glycosyltransferase family 2 protein [Lachnospiraceae bacterium]
MKHGCLVSVIIPVYNVEPYLAEALDSVLRQTYEDLEVIIIDDGSTDNSGKICDEYAGKDRRVFVTHQENKGLSAARNAGLDLMHGEALVFLDPDDAYHPEFVSAMMEAMFREHSDLVLCKYTVHKTKIRGTRWKKSFPLAKQGIYDRISALQALADGTIGAAVWNKLYRSGLWQDIRFPEGQNYEDVETAFQVLDVCKKVYVLDRALYLHRKRSGSITNTHTWQNFQDRMLAGSHFASFIEANTPEVFTMEQLKRIRQQRINGMLSLYLHFSKETTGEGWITREDLEKQIIDMGGGRDRHQRLRPADKGCLPDALRLPAPSEKRLSGIPSCTIAD